jgi:uncharacterized repeat protein (TIGR01451 family)
VRPSSCSRVILAGGVCGLFLAFAARSNGFENQVLPGHVPKAAKSIQPIGRLAADKRLNLAIGLPLRNTRELSDLLQQIYDPSSTNFHHYLTPDQFTQRFGPTENDYLSVVEFARSNNLNITGTHPNRMLVDVCASVGEIESALHVNLQLYQHPKEARTFYGPDTDPVCPAGVPILHIGGLNNYLVPHPAGLRLGPEPTSSGPVPLAGPGSGPAGAYRGTDFRGVYARSVSLNGAGQMVGLLEFDGFYQSDVTNYWAQASMAAIPIVIVTLDGFDGSPGTDNVEAALDIEMASSMAPGLSAIILYEAGANSPADDILNRMATDNLAKQLSASWTYPIDPTTEQIFQQFAAQGQTYINASGDNGAYSGVVDTPTDDPNVTVVGGTTLTATGPGGAWKSETVWNRGGSGPTLGGSGGGISTVYPIPSWQKPVSMTSNQGSSTMRNLPDVAAVAENVWVTYNNGSSEVVGGTSCSAPLWAGFNALVNQQAASFGQPPVGFLNPAIYAIGLSTNYNSDFHDITIGNNTNNNSPTQFFAVTGYDLCTGWGSPAGQNLINALASRVQARLITSAGVGILFESCPNGAIDPGETVIVNFSLKNLGALKTTSLLASLQADQGVGWPSAPQNYGTLTGGGPPVSRAFTFTANGACGTTLTANLHLQDGSADLGNLPVTFTLGQPITVLTQNFDSVTAPLLPSGWTTAVSNGVYNWVTSTQFHDTAPNAAFADEPPSQGIEELISPPISIASSTAFLTFRNSFDTEADPGLTNIAYDGGVLEIQIGTNAFADILDAGGTFISGGYNRTIYTGTNADSPFKGRQVWGGNSIGFITTGVTLPASAAGQSIQLKWRFGLDTGNFYGGSGWYIDSVSIRDGASCCVSSSDLAVSTTTWPEPVSPGQLLTYSVMVTNLGPSSSYGIEVTNFLPVGIVFSSGSPGCTYTNGLVLCDAWTLAAGTVTNYIFEVIPATTDPITNTSVVSSFTTDPNSSNNSTSTISTVATNNPPIVYVQPTNAVAVRGGSATLQAKAFGITPLGYQWFFNNSPISGQTDASLSLTNVQPEQSGSYSIVVTNIYGATTSAVVQVFIIAQPAIQLTGLGSSTGSMAVSFSSVAGLSYTLEYKNSLSDAAWIPILPPVSGTGTPLSLADTNAVALPTRFYRITAQ